VVSQDPIFKVFIHSQSGTVASLLVQLVMAFVFLIRAIGDFRFVGFFKKEQMETLPNMTA